MHVRPVALGGEKIAPVSEPALNQLDVGLLAGLEDASLDLMGSVLGDHPVGRLWAVLGTEVGALADVRTDSSQFRDERGKCGRLKSRPLS